MRAAVLKSPGDLSVADVEVPRPGPGEVLVRVAAAGICMGDLHIYNGKNPYAKYPCICGHEMAGAVADLGDGIAGLADGARVVVEPFIGCGRCSTCRAGKSNCCPRLSIIGVHRPGGYAEYLTAPASHVHAVPADMALTTAALTEPVAIGVQACRRGQVVAGDVVLVLGCGPIGLACIEVALARGARVLAADVLPARLEAAAGVGAEVLRADDDLIAAVHARSDGEGVPVVIEATGNVKAMESTLALVAAGGRIVIVGLVKDGLGVTLAGLDLTRKEPTIVGSRASVGCFPESLALLRDGKIKLGKLVTELPMWDAPAIFAGLARDSTSVHKAMLVV